MTASICAAEKAARAIASPQGSAGGAGASVGQGTKAGPL